MICKRDGHIRVLPVHVANKIAAGEVVERPSSVAKELIENAIDAGARHIRLSVMQGGRKLISVQDDGCGMNRDDALLCLERQATSKILDVEDIENIDTLGFRGEAIPSIASVSRFSLTTRPHDEDEGTFIQVNAGAIAEIRSAGAPPGTLIEVRDLFCNVPARQKFLRAYATEESHVRQVFTTHALAHPQIGFTLVADGREVCRLPPCDELKDRVLELFSADFLESLKPLSLEQDGVKINGFIEKPNLNLPTRRDQYIFVNNRPATSPSIAYALREAYPHRQGDAKPAAIIFIDVSPKDVDVNVHPAKREVRFRKSAVVKQALIDAVAGALLPPKAIARPVAETPAAGPSPLPDNAPAPTAPEQGNFEFSAPPPAAPVQIELPLEPDTPNTAPWRRFRFLALTESGFLLIETDSGIVTVNPKAARERIIFERMTDTEQRVSQPLLIPETVRFSPPEFARIGASLKELSDMGWSLEEFGRDTFKIEAVPASVGQLPSAAVLATIAQDLGNSSAKRDGEKWRLGLIAKSIARSCAMAPSKLDEKLAVKLVEELAACRMPYVSPAGKPIMVFTSNRELNRKFSLE